MKIKLFRLKNSKIDWEWQEQILVWGSICGKIKMRRTNIYIIRDKGREENEIEDVFKEIMPESLINLVKDINLQNQEAEDE